MTINLSHKKYGYVECGLCPNHCKLKKGDRGKCFVRECDGDTIFLSNYGELVSVAINPIEKKPFTGYLPGTKTLSIGGIGCSLNCNFCENHEISQPKELIHYRVFTIDNLIDIALEKHCKSICMTFNEPTISFEYLIDLAESCHKNDLKFVLKTNAYVNKRPWAEICRVTDAMNIDYKGCESQYREIIGASEYVIEDRIKEAYKAGVYLEISIPIYSNNLEGVEEMSYFLGSLDKNIPCHLLKVSPSYEFLEPSPTDEQILELAKEVMSSQLKNIFME